MSVETSESSPEEIMDVVLKKYINDDFENVENSVESTYFYALKDAAEEYGDEELLELIKERKFEKALRTLHN